MRRIWLVPGVAAIAVSTACGGHPSGSVKPVPVTSPPALLPGYIGQDENSVTFLQLQPSDAGQYVGTLTQTLWKGGIANNVEHDSAGVDAQVSGNAITLSVEGTSVSGRISGNELVLGLTDDTVGYHEVTFSPGTGAAYQAAVQRFDTAWNAPSPAPSPTVHYR